MKKQSNNIGALRFIGATLVLFGHGFVLCGGKHSAIDPISALVRKYTPFNVGLPGIGVMLFFVLSGYLITASYQKRQNLIEFTVARLLRIYPALFLAVLFCVFGIGLWITSLPMREYLLHPLTWKYFFGNATLIEFRSHLPGVFTTNPFAGGVNGSLWTLPVELHMYIMVALAGVLGFLDRRVLFNAVAVLTVLIYISNPETFPLLKIPHHVYLGLSFLSGSFFYINREYIQIRLIGLLGLVFVVVISWNSFFHQLIFTVAFAYGVLWVGLTNIIQLPRLDKYGDFSYGLYLYAFPFQQLSILWIGPSHPMLVNGIAFICSLMMAGLSWFLVERIALRYKSTISNAVGRWGITISSRKTILTMKALLER